MAGIFQLSKEPTDDESIPSPLLGFCKATDMAVIQAHDGSAVASAFPPPRTTTSSGRPRVFLPSNKTEITGCAEILMRIIAPKRELFSKGSSLVQIIQNDEGLPQLAEVTPVAFRSLSENYAEFWVRTDDSNGRPVESARRMSRENAAAIMECRSAISLLPRVKAIANFPPLRRDGTTQKEGFDPDTGILVSGKVEIEKMSSSEAVPLLLGLLIDWKFASPADQSRAIAMIIAPMLRLGPWVNDRVAFPIFTIEADLSQTGKGMLMQVTAGIYGEMPAIVTQPIGGVGSFDESLSSALMKGRPIIQMDNLRGRLRSQVLEAFVTARGPFHTRALRREQEVDSRRFVLYATSNGIESTEDAANRMCVTRLRKQQLGHPWHKWPEGSLLKHVEVNRSKYLGAICAVLRKWIDAKEPIIECNHDFREWAGASNWIVEKVFNLPPMMEGHDEVKVRVSTPGLGFLREMALRIKSEEETFTASELAERAQIEEVPIPGWESEKKDPTALNKHMGSLLAKCFKESDTITVEEISIQREERDIPREGGGSWKSKVYLFRKVPISKQEELPAVATLLSSSTQ